MTSAHPEAPDTLLEALQGASIIEEHHTLMGAVIEKIQSAESGLNEACISLIKGFEVCFSKSVMVWIVAPDTLSGERKEPDRGSNLCSQEDSLNDIYFSSVISRRL